MRSTTHGLSVFWPIAAGSDNSCAAQPLDAVGAPPSASMLIGICYPVTLISLRIGLQWLHPVQGGQVETVGSRNYGPKSCRWGHAAG